MVSNILIFEKIDIAILCSLLKKDNIERCLVSNHPTVEFQIGKVED